MLKLYSIACGDKLYWETWEAEPGKNIVHWGRLGTKGDTKTVVSRFLRPADKVLQKEIDERLAEGFGPVSPEDYAVVLIEYLIEGMGSEQDLEKRHRLEDRMNETLGWTGLGMCEGGSIGSGAMEVSAFVVDAEVAKTVIEEDLKNTEFSDYSRVYVG